MLLSLRKNGLTSLFKEVRVFQVLIAFSDASVTLLLPSQEPRKGAFWKSGFCKNVRLSWLWRSECQIYRCVQYVRVLFLVLLGVTLDSAETRFAKPPFLALKTATSLN